MRVKVIPTTSQIHELSRVFKPMALAAFRCLILFFCGVLTARAGAPTLRTFDGISYLSAVDAASHLGMRVSYTNHGAPGSRPGVILYNQEHHTILGSESRECLIDGLRVFLGDPVISRTGRLYISFNDYSRRLTPHVAPQLCSSVPRLPRVIVIDPGHGGTDTGMANPRLGLREKVLTLDVARRLKAILETAGYKVVLTRDSDQFVELKLRAELANMVGADLFVSIHFNAGPPGDSRIHGTEIMTFPLAGQRSDQSWNDRINDKEAYAAPVNRFDMWSEILAGCIHRDVLAALGTEDRGQKTKHLGALRGLNCPAVLVESAFLSSDIEGGRVAQPAYRHRIAQSLATGISSYVRVIERLKPGAKQVSVQNIPPSEPARAAPTRP